MLTAASAETLLGDNRFALSLVRPDGDILYENNQACGLWGSQVRARTILERLTVSSRWSEIMQKVADNDPVVDEPVLIESADCDVEQCYLTALPQRNGAGSVDSLLCIWASRRNGFTHIATETPGETLSEYTRDLEAILEHRTYHRMLMSEQDEYARAALDSLSVGVLITDPTGEIIYRNESMTDIFGFRSGELLEPHIKYILDAQALVSFRQVVESGLRKAVGARDPGGREAMIELLPLLRGSEVCHVVLQYSRSAALESK